MPVDHGVGGEQAGDVDGGAHGRATLATTRPCGNSLSVRGVSVPVARVGAGTEGWCMSFVPVTGPARLLVGEPPREGSIEFTDDRRTIVMPIRGALPVLGKVRDQDDLHPSVGAARRAPPCSGLQLVAAGRFAPDPEGRHWQVAGLDAARRAPDRRAGAGARARRLRRGDGRGHGPGAARRGRRHRPPHHAGPLAATARRRHARPAPTTSPDDFSDQLQQRIARIRARGRDDRPHLVSVSFRIEADEEELVAGAVRLVVQVHAVDNAAHVADAVELWADTGPDAAHGFGERARTHAAIALRTRRRRLARPRPAARPARPRRDHPRLRRDPLAPRRAAPPR